MNVLRAEPSDWRQVRTIRLRGLLDAPDAFGSTHAQEAEEDEVQWRAWATGWPGTTDQAVFAAVDDVIWVGIAVGVRWEEELDAVHLYGMWVDPSSRRKGVGRALVGAIIAWASDLGAERMLLRVTEGNPAALALYESSGFVDVGEREPLREGSDIRAIVMRCPV